MGRYYCATSVIFPRVNICEHGEEEEEKGEGHAHPGSSHVYALHQRIYIALHKNNGQHPPSSLVETTPPACSVGSYTDRQVVQYTAYRGKEASQFKTTVGGGGLQTIL